MLLVCIHAAGFIATWHLAARESLDRRAQEASSAAFRSTMREVRDQAVAHAAAEEAARAVLDAAEIPPIGVAVQPWARAVTRAILGDLGTIPGAAPRPVGALIAEALPRTLVLIALALGVAALLGVVGGILAVDRRTGDVSPAAGAIALVGFAMPAFMLGILGVHLALHVSRLSGGRIPTLPAIGFGLDEHLVLPVIALALRPAAEVARVLAELLGDELRSDYVRTALAKGRTSLGALVRHAVPNAAGAVVIALGGSLLTLFSSAIVVESLFEWPGLGRQLATALAPRTDGRPSSAVFLHPESVAALLVVVAALHLGALVGADWLAVRLDPRLRRNRPDDAPASAPVEGA